MQDVRMDGDEGRQGPSERIGQTNKYGSGAYPKLLMNSFLLTLIALMSCCMIVNGNMDDSTMRNQRKGKTIDRISYGVIFEHKDDVILSTHQWSHVFIIKLPQRSFLNEQDYLEQLNLGETPARALCLKSNEGHFYTDRTGLNFCKRMEKHVAFMIEMAHSGYQNLHSLIDDIYSLLPISLKQPSPNRVRQSRALFPILGSWLSSLTGLALQSDLDALHNNIVQIADFVDKETNFSRKFVSDTALFVKLTNNRMDNLINEVNNRSILTAKLIERVDKDSTHLIDYYANITLHKFQFHTAISNLELQYSNLLNAIELLIHGRLPSYLFSENVLQEMLQIVQTSISKTFQGNMEILHKDIHYYLKRGQFLCTRYNDNLYVQLNVPLTNILDEFSFFHVKTYPIPLHQDQYPHVTQVEGLPQAIGISVTTSQYFSLDILELQHLHHEMNQFSNRIFLKTDPRDCISAIFFDDKEQIKIKCTFSILLHGMESKVYNLYDNLFLLVNISSYSLQCHSKQPESSNCSVCLIQIEKHCTFQTNSIIIPKIYSSETTQNTSKQQYIVNLAVLVNLFDHDLIQQITGDSKFFIQPELKLPSYSFYANALSKNFAESEKVKISLQKASLAIKNDEEIVQNLGQAILTGKLEIETNYFLSTPGIITEILATLVIILILNNLYINFKIKQLLLTVSILQSRITETESVDQIILDFYKESKHKLNASVEDTLLSVYSQDVTFSIVNSIALYVILILIVAFAILKVTSFYKRKRLLNSCELFLLFQTGNEYKYFPFMQISQPFEDLVIQSQKQMKNVRILGKWYPKIFFEWDLKIFNKFSKQDLFIPKSIPIPKLEIGWMQKVLKQPFNVMLVYDIVNQFHMYSFDYIDVKNMNMCIAEPQSISTNVKYDKCISTVSLTNSIKEPHLTLEENTSLAV